MPLARQTPARSRAGVLLRAGIPMLGAALAAVITLPPAAVAGAATGPDLAAGSAYLVAPANLIHGHYYESFPGFADYGLTISGALALAATGDENPWLKGIINFFIDGGKDPHGITINGWTGIGTHDVVGGSLADETLLAEVTGYNPRDFGGQDLITALDAAVCAHRHGTRCPAVGSYVNSFSVFDQALGILAQLRAGQASEAAAPVRYLESLQHSDGSFPSLIPPTGDQDVDSTAMAAMALALVKGKRAAAAVTAGLAWIAGRQQGNGGFPGTSGESVNSAGLAIQGLTLQAARYRTQIGAALGFLAREQNGNGGFNVAAGQHGSNVRASTQALGGAVGTSFGTLRRNLSGTPNPPPTQPPPKHHKPTGTPLPTVYNYVPPPSSSPPAPTPEPMAAVGTPPGGTTPPAAHSAFTDASSDSAALAADLWWAVIGVAVAGGAVIGVLLLRRRRPPRPGGPGRPGGPHRPRWPRRPRRLHPAYPVARGRR